MTFSLWKSSTGGVWILNGSPFKGTQMGPLLVLVCSWFTKNVNVTCKIVSFLCSLDYFLVKSVIVFFFGNQISKWRSIEKRAIFDLLFTLFFSAQGNARKIPSALTYIHIFCSPYWLFCLPNFAKIANLLYMVSLWCDFWALFHKS